MTSHPDPSLPEDKTLWEILPTTFTDADGNQWMFRKITLRDIDRLAQEGVTVDHIVLEMDLIQTMKLSYQFLSPVTSSDLEKPDLDSYMDLLQENVLDEAYEAFRRCLTNFFPRNQRIAIREMILKELQILSAISQKRLELYLTAVKQQESTDFASPLPGPSESPPGDGACEI